MNESRVKKVLLLASGTKNFVQVAMRGVVYRMKILYEADDHFEVVCVDQLESGVRWVARNSSDFGMAGVLSTSSIETAHLLHS